jgi:hypothetical protein
MLSLRRILLTSSLFTPCLSVSTPQPTLHPRQEMETRTIDVTSSMELQGGATSVIPSSTTSYRLETATPPIQLADTIGLIMPNPWSKLYVGTSRGAIATDIVGLNYSLGFVDVVPKPAPTVGGWLRQIQPLLMLPNNRVSQQDGVGRGGADHRSTSFPQVGPMKWMMSLPSQSGVMGSAGESQPMIQETSLRSASQRKTTPSRTHSRSSNQDGTCS